VTEYKFQVDHTVDGRMPNEAKLWATRYSKLVVPGQSQHVYVNT